MIAARRLIVCVIVLHKLRRIVRQRIDHAACQSIAAGFIVLGSLGVHGLFLFKTRLLGIFCIKIAVGSDTGHIVHGHGSGRLDAGVLRGGVDSHPAPAADADDTDTLRVDVLLHGKEVHGGAEILCVDIG